MTKEEKDFLDKAALALVPLALSTPPMDTTGNKCEVVFSWANALLRVRRRVFAAIEAEEKPARVPWAFPRPPRDEVEREACEDRDEVCGVDGGDEWALECTRAPHHTGDHVAVAGVDAIIARWPSESSS